jgi:hypothetical protein
MENKDLEFHMDEDYIHQIEYTILKTIGTVNDFEIESIEKVAKCRQ